MNYSMNYSGYDSDSNTETINNFNKRTSPIGSAAKNPLENKKKKSSNPLEITSFQERKIKEKLLRQLMEEREQAEKRNRKQKNRASLSRRKGNFNFSARDSGGEEGEDEDDDGGVYETRCVTKKRKQNQKDYHQNQKDNHQNQKDGYYGMFVIDLDETLIYHDDENMLSEPFEGTCNFVRKLLNEEFPWAFSLIWTKGNEEHVKNYWNTGPKFQNDFNGYMAEDFQFCIGKPAVYARRVLPPHIRDSIKGPMILIDDKEENLRPEHYDILIDVKPFIKNNTLNWSALIRAIRIEYDIWRTQPLCNSDVGLKSHINDGV